MPWLSPRALLSCRSRAQKELNLLHEGPLFDVASRYANALAITAVAMLYFAAIPVVVPIACFSYIVMYWMEKLLCKPAPRRPVVLTARMVMHYVCVCVCVCV